MWFTGDAWGSAATDSGARQRPRQVPVKQRGLSNITNVEPRDPALLNMVTHVPITVNNFLIFCYRTCSLFSNWQYHRILYVQICDTLNRVSSVRNTRMTYYIMGSSHTSPNLKLSVLSLRIYYTPRQWRRLTNHAQRTRDKKNQQQHVLFEVVQNCLRSVTLVVIMVAIINEISSTIDGRWSFRFWRF